ncbi:GGDEF domain-containing protein [Pseudomonas syringae]|uniref:diguanylate cyclase n=1 Tax=Pseudomonas syringae TaxID=317 RepID=A0A085VM80_PSESX|nr:GGDEF domain-containing protein [Pseudomonas syringae]KFE56543.1 DeoR faimly transcriptional regulator [Pseudomonas syringae]
MSDEAERWREKYLKGIEQQDKLEKRWNARLDLLRRGLVRSSLAAEGSDRAVDQCMKEMREIVRKDDMDAGLAALIPKLEKAVLDSEQRREVRAGQISSALVSLVSQLQSLDLPKDVRKPLKRFAKDLEERASQARELPLLLGELSGLQGRALTQIEKPEEQARPGLLARLFGGHEASPAGAEPGDATAQLTPLIPEPAPGDFDAYADDRGEPDPSPTAVAAPTQPAGTSTGRYEPLAAVEPAAVASQHVQVVQAAAKPREVVEAAGVEVVAKVDPLPAPLPEPEPVAERVAASELEPVATQDLLTPTPSVPFEQFSEPFIVGLDEEASEQSEEAAPFSLPSSPEPSYSSVATHIEETLLGLLNDLTLPEHHRPQAEAMRKRLEHGLNWYELLPILEDLAVLMLAISDGGQQDFESYLKQLNERLESFQSNLQAASEDYVGQQSESRELNNQLREQVDGLQSSVQDAADLNSLKQVLESRLEGLLSTMDQHQVTRDEREQNVAARLQSLASRVATMEQEALGFRANIEEQRQKALIDPLTSLPNRAAWEERLGHEVALWQRDKNSLLLGILDLDHFKRINDGFGHLAGDRVLKIVAKVLKKHLRGGDFIARFGGEEFVVLMPATPVGAGLALLDQLRTAVELCPFHFKSEPVVITVSIGVTALRPGERSDVALKRADQALYRAKENGRNQVEQG